MQLQGTVALELILVIACVIKNCIVTLTRFIPHMYHVVKLSVDIVAMRLLGKPEAYSSRTYFDEIYCYKILVVEIY